MSQSNEIPISENAPFAPAPPVPKLSIAFLLAEMTVLSIVLALAMPMLQKSQVLSFGKLEESETRTLRLLMMLSLLRMLVIAASLPAVFILWRHGRLHPTFRFQPGHWLLALAGFEAIVLLTSSLLVNANQNPGDALYVNFVGFTITLDMMLKFFSQLAKGVLAVFALRRSADTAMWKTFFLGAAALSLLSWFIWTLFVQLMSVFGTLPSELIGFGLPIIAAGVLLLALVSDLRSGKSRDWLHWFGAAIFFAHYATGIASYTAWSMMYGVLR